MSSTWSATRQPPHRRASRLCRVRQGRPAEQTRWISIRTHVVLLTRSKRPPGRLQHPPTGQDHGQLTDSNGKKIDFRNVVLIMTTNAGASDAQKNSIGFGRGKADDEVDEALKRLFTHRNSAPPRRRGAVQVADPEIIRQVVQKFVMQLEAQLADRHVTIETSDEATDWLAKNGFDELYGARPLARVIQEHIKKPLADEILFGRLVKGGHVKVVLRDSEAGLRHRGRRTRTRRSGDREPGRGSRTGGLTRPACHLDLGEAKAGPIGINGAVPGLGGAVSIPGWGAESNGSRSSPARNRDVGPC